METTDWNPKKPYDLRERLFEFGCLVIRLVQYLHTRGPVAMKLSEQFLKAGTSAPANYEESDDGSGTVGLGSWELGVYELLLNPCRLMIFRRLE
jgi:hypothetical protein